MSEPILWQQIGIVAVVAGGVIVCVWALYSTFKEEREAKAAELEAYKEAYEYLKKQPGVKVLPKTGALVLPLREKEQRKKDEES